MSLDDLVRDEQPESQSRDVGRVIAARERLEQPRLGGSVEADAAICHGDGDALRLVGHLDFDRFALRGVLQRVVDEVREDLVEPRGICHHDRAVRRMDRDSRLVVRRVDEARRDLVDQGDHVRGLAHRTVTLGR